MKLCDTTSRLSVYRVRSLWAIWLQWLSVLKHVIRQCVGSTQLVAACVLSSCTASITRNSDELRRKCEKTRSKTGSLARTWSQQCRSNAITVDRENDCVTTSIHYERADVLHGGSCFMSHMLNNAQNISRSQLSSLQIIERRSKEVFILCCCICRANHVEINWNNDNKQEEEIWKVTKTKWNATNDWSARECAEVARSGGDL